MKNNIKVLANTLLERSNFCYNLAEAKNNENNKDIVFSLCQKSVTYKNVAEKLFSISNSKIKYFEFKKAQKTIREREYELTKIILNNNFKFNIQKICAIAEQGALREIISLF